MAVLSTMAALSRLSGRNGRFIIQKRANGRFHIVPHKQFINGQRPGQAFLERAGKASGRFIRPASRILFLLLAQLLRKLLIKLLM